MDVKHVLIPVDGSEHSDKAVRLAADIAAKYGAKLTLLHVLISGRVPDNLRKLSDKAGRREPAMAVGAGYVEAHEPIEVLQDIGNKLLEKAESAARELGADNIEKIVTGGVPSEQVLEHAESGNADLIVMGSRGLGGIKGMLVGATSHKVQNVAKCSVITVK